MTEIRAVRTCTRLTLKGRPCRRWALRGAPWCNLHTPLREPVLCVGGPWDGDPADVPDRPDRCDSPDPAAVWQLWYVAPEVFCASPWPREQLADLDIVGSYRLVREGDAFAFVWERERAPDVPRETPIPRAPGESA
ncbi:MAG: hypothetical protein ACREMN_11565 [Gemmatimonadales bacterium]